MTRHDYIALFLLLAAFSVGEVVGRILYDMLIAAVR